MNMMLIDSAEVPIIKLRFRGVLVDISIDQIGGLATLILLREIDELIGRNGLLKRSVLMIKSWFLCEANLLGSFMGCMATYALYVLVVHIINNYGGEEGLKTPLDVFKRFF